MPLQVGSVSGHGKSDTASTNAYVMRKNRKPSDNSKIFKADKWLAAVLSALRSAYYYTQWRSAFSQALKVMFESCLTAGENAHRVLQ